MARTTPPSSRALRGLARIAGLALALNASSAWGDGAGPAPAPPRTVALPAAGRHRAPVLLQLAGELHGLPVRVADKGVNDIEVDLPPRLATRPVSIEQLSAFLATQGIHLNVWDHPRVGKLLVASARLDWMPPSSGVRRTLDFPAARFERAWELVDGAVKAHNRSLPPASPRVVAVRAERDGKILLWAPQAATLDAIVAPVGRWQDEVKSAHLPVRSHRGRFLTAAKLESLLHEKLSQSERVELRSSTWGSILFYRGREKLAAKAAALLKELDRPARTSSTPRNAP